MLRALAGKRDGSDADMGELSDEDGSAVISAPLASTHVEAAYQVMREAMGKECSVFDVGFKEVVERHEDWTGAS